MNNILDLLNPEEMKLIKKIGCLKGKILFSEHDECEYLGIVIKGQINISSVTMNGTEIVYNTLKEGDVFGNNLLFSTTPKFRGDVIASSDSVVALLDKKSLLFIFKNNEKFLLKYLEIQSDFGKKLNLQIKLLSLNNAEDRFMYYLSVNNNNIKYESISSLANKLFLQRETLSRLISKLVKKGIIIRRKKSISIM